MWLICETVCACVCAHTWICASVCVCVCVWICIWSCLLCIMGQCGNDKCRECQQRHTYLHCGCCRQHFPTVPAQHGTPQGPPLKTTQPTTISSTWHKPHWGELKTETEQSLQGFSSNSEATSTPSWIKLNWSCKWQTTLVAIFFLQSTMCCSVIHSPWYNHHGWQNW